RVRGSRARVIGPWTEPAWVFTAEPRNQVASSSPRPRHLAVVRARASDRAQPATGGALAEPRELRLDLGSHRAVGPALEVQPVGAARLVAASGDAQQSSEIEGRRAGLAGARVLADQLLVELDRLLALARLEQQLGLAGQRGGRARAGLERWLA